MQRGGSNEGVDSGRQTPVAEDESAPTSAPVNADVEMSDQQESGDGEGDVSMAETDGHRRSDHDRQDYEKQGEMLPPEILPKGLYKLSTERKFSHSAFICSVHVC